MRVVIVRVILVGVRCVTVVHIGHDEVLVVVLKYVAIFVVIFCNWRCTLYMGQEICLIHGQVSLSLLHWKKTSRWIYVVRGETDKKAANIQARSFMARTLGENGKECQADGEAKVVT